MRQGNAVHGFAGVEHARRFAVADGKTERHLPALLLARHDEDARLGRGQIETIALNLVGMQAQGQGGIQPLFGLAILQQTARLLAARMGIRGKDGNRIPAVVNPAIGQRLALVGNLEFPDVYERPRDQVDLMISKKILKKKGELKLTWADLLNPAYYFYENLDSKKAYEKGTDRLFYSFRPGSTVTVGFTYDFNIGKN